jgi:hypothetical protein
METKVTTFNQDLTDEWVPDDRAQFEKTKPICRASPGNPKHETCPEQSRRIRKRMDVCRITEQKTFS